MKFAFAAIFVAFLCAAAVSAAPALIDALSTLDEVELDQFDNLFDELNSVDGEDIDSFSMFDVADDELINREEIKKFFVKVKCITRAYDTGVKGTKYQKIFDEHRKWMKPMLAGIKKCLTDSNKWKRAVCIAKELKTGVPSLIPFLKEFYKMKEELKSQPELSARVEAEKQKCNV